MNFDQFTQALSSQNYLYWCGTGLYALVALDTVVRLWTDRHRLVKDELNEEDRAFAWRLVVFLVFPALMWIDLRSTAIALGQAGGQLIDQQFGLIWYRATLEGIQSMPPQTAALVYMAGEIVQIGFALLLVPALFFRPHPFLASFLGYAVAFTLGFNLLADPILSLAGFGLPRWEQLLRIGMTNPSIVYPIVGIHCALTGLYLFAITSSAVRLWFSDLTRPQISQELQELQISLDQGQKSLMRARIGAYKGLADGPSATLALKLGLLYVRAGLTRQAGKVCKQMKSLFPQSVCTAFLEGMLAFQVRNYKLARQAFIATADYPLIDGELKASLLAAAACSAYAQNDTEGALDLCERALEFEDACLTARMVKVDAYLAKGKKEAAAQEIMVAMHLGLDFDLKDHVPVNSDVVFEMLCQIEERVESAMLRDQVEQLEANLERSGTTPK